MDQCVLEQSAREVWGWKLRLTGAMVVLRDRMVWGAWDFRWVKAGDLVQCKDVWTGMKC